MSSIKKSVIDKLFEEMGNIDHCMHYFTHLARHKKKDSAILGNHSDNENDPTTSSLETSIESHEFNSEEGTDAKILD